MDVFEQELEESESPGFEAEEPDGDGVMSQKRAPSEHLGLALARRRRMQSHVLGAKESRPTTSVSGHSGSRLPPSLPGSASTRSLDTGSCVKVFKVDPHWSQEVARLRFMASIPEELKRVVRFANLTPGDRVRDCDMCDLNSGTFCEIFGWFVYMMWAHLGESLSATEKNYTVEGGLCFWCNKTLRNNYPGFKNLLLKST